jgi:hypothetical protein
MYKYGRSIFFRLTFPIIMISGYLSSAVDVKNRSTSQLLSDMIFFSPLLIIGLWLLLVPRLVVVDKNNNYVTVYHFLASKKIKLESIIGAKK